MSSLSQARCEACNNDAKPLNKGEQDELLKQLPDWSVVLRDNVQQLQRTYTFKDFKSALAFTNAIGALAEEQDHHPTLVTEWGRVSVSWWTHAIKGLHRNDFIMAARSDDAASQLPGTKPST